MKTLLFIGGVFHITFALFHLGFWKLFNWKEQLGRLDFINRNVMQILNLCLTFVFFVFAWISFAHPGELLETKLGHTLLAAISLFWILRATEQVVFFGLRHPQSVGLFIAFVFGAGIYAVPLFNVIVAT